MRGGPVSRETGQLRVAVVGTGTGVGKTHTAVALVAALAARGDKVCGLKPIESGVDGLSVSDADQMAAVSSVQPEPAPYRFPGVGLAAPGGTPPRQRHLAGRRGVLCRDAKGARGDCRERRRAPLPSPLGTGLTNADLVERARS
ncbi:MULTISPECIES: AAA family ATPase [Sorangium]|uniref:Uncharacterized protein n=1 Tax=Sorangium cellulosum TaxID=56 RepID=A0A4P2R3F6_SORCE|nr:MULTISPECIES: AAA family ATPase [Sorangium]AUX37579.1 uncharacterized protein SOCE836_098080 [Sorangium cellulosum]